MKALYIIAVTLNIFTYIAIVILNFYFGWQIISSVFGIITSKPNAFELLGRNVVNFFIYNIISGVFVALTGALTEYLKSKIDNKIAK